MTMKEITQVMSLAEKYYPKNKLKHAIRVANYAYEDAKSRNNVDTIAAFVIGIAHDLLEDTAIQENRIRWEINEEVLQLIKELTNPNVRMYAQERFTPKCL